MATLTAPLQETAFTELITTYHGPMIVLKNDQFVTPCLRKHGQYSPGEVAVFKRFVTKDALAVEVGANMGAHTLALARFAGTVVAFEPQRIAFQVLCGNLALNSLYNVHAFHGAVGAVDGFTHIEFASPWHECNYGGISTGPEGEVVPLRTLDGMKLPALDFLKLDCEGAEPDVLAGAVETIRCHWPAIYLEFDSNRERIVDLLRSLGYVAWRHFPRHAPGSEWHSDMVLAMPAHWHPDQSFLTREGFTRLEFPHDRARQGGDAGSNAGAGKPQSKGA